MVIVCQDSYVLMLMMINKWKKFRVPMIILDAPEMKVAVHCLFNEDE
jgi:hypothetical protein